ncbi:NAD-binding protein, partial [bacterium]|nr:NAD-binding protein [bacterium]
HKGEHYDIILFGCNRIGFSLLETIGSTKKKLLIIDNDPEVITDLATEGYECKYGDAEDTELLNATNFSTAKMVISTIPDIETNLILLRKIRKLNNNIIIIIVSHQIEEALQLYESGATYVLMPYFLGGQHASTMIQKVGMDLNEFIKEKERHMSHLKKRSKLKHAHPKAEKHW